MLGARGRCPGPPDPGRPGRDDCREPWGSTAVGLLPAQRRTAGRCSEKPRCSIRKGTLPRTNDGAPRIRLDLTKAAYAPFTGPPESPRPAHLAPISIPGGCGTTETAPAQPAASAYP
ncbi:uncharacterized protein O9250_011192 isoform 1-T3 [Rhynochetos jubatus]